jgi:hypothetical protein
VTDLKLFFVNAVMFALLLAASAESRSAPGAVMVGVSLQVVDACGVASQADSVRVRCRSTMKLANGSTTDSRTSPALVSEQWCPRDKFAATAQESVCSEARAPGSDLQLVFTF